MNLIMARITHENMAEIRVITRSEKIVPNLCSVCSSPGTPQAGIDPG